TKPVVLGGGLGPGLLEEPLEELLALGRDPVHVLAPPHLLLVEDPFDGALLLEAADGRVERAVGDAPEPAQGVGQSLRELVAVHGPLFQQTEDRELEHPTPSVLRFDISPKYIGPIYRTTTSPRRQPARRGPAPAAGRRPGRAWPPRHRPPRTPATGRRGSARTRTSRARGRASRRSRTSSRRPTGIARARAGERGRPRTRRRRGTRSSRRGSTSRPSRPAPAPLGRPRAT